MTVRSVVENEVKELIVQILNQPEITVDEVEDEMPLFSDGLGLDSIDLLELVVMLDRKYGLKIKNDEKGRKILQNVNTIVESIEVVQN
ncbi:MAG: acyl carrier protein [Desulfobacterales bacterium]|nr:acyl carrier protein [Desulfobacterales bacterium]MCP4160420.1 acyl carrier protein [Deltaproteobacteria bacterium]